MKLCCRIQNFGGRKFWRIWKINFNSPKHSQPNIICQIHASSKIVKILCCQNFVSYSRHSKLYNLKVISPFLSGVLQHGCYEFVCGISKAPIRGIRTDVKQQYICASSYWFKVLSDLKSYGSNQGTTVYS